MSDDSSTGVKRGWLARLTGAGEAQMIAAFEAELLAVQTRLAEANQRLEQELAHRDLAYAAAMRAEQALESSEQQLITERASAGEQLEELASQLDELRSRLDNELRRSAALERERIAAEARAAARDRARAADAEERRRVERELVRERDAAIAARERVTSERAALVAAQARQHLAQRNAAMETIANAEAQVATLRDELAGVQQHLRGAAALVATLVVAVERCVGSRADALIELQVALARREHIADPSFARSLASAATALQSVEPELARCGWVVAIGPERLG